MNFKITSASSNSNLKITHSNGTIVNIKNFKTLQFSSEPTEINVEKQEKLVVNTYIGFHAKTHGDVIESFFRKFGALKQLTILPFSKYYCKVLFAYENNKNTSYAIRALKKRDMNIKNNPIEDWIETGLPSTPKYKKRISKNPLDDELPPRKTQSKKVDVEFKKKLDKELDEIMKFNQSLTNSSKVNSSEVNSLEDSEVIITESEKIRALKCFRLPRDVEVGGVKLFEKYGTIDKIKTIHDKISYTIIVFKDIRDRDDALELDGCTFGGKMIGVEKYNYIKPSKKITIEEDEDFDSFPKLNENEINKAIKITNLPSNVTENEIFEIVSVYADVEKVYIVRGSQKSSIAIVVLKYIEGVEYAFELDGLRNKKMDITMDVEKYIPNFRNASWYEKNDCKHTLGPICKKCCKNVDHL